MLDSFLLYGNVVKSAKVRPIKLLSVPKIEFIDLLVIHESLMALVDALHVFVHFFGLFDVKSLALWQFFVIFLLHVVENSHKFEIEDDLYQNNDADHYNCSH